MQINYSNKINFGLRIVKTPAYKTLIKEWDKIYNKSDINIAIQKLKNSANNDYYIEADSINNNGTLKFRIFRLLEDPKSVTAQVKYYSPDAKTYLYYSPRKVAREIVKNINNYTRELTKHSPAFGDVFCIAAREKAKWLF